MSLRPLATHFSAVSSLYAPYTTTGGGGGGGSVITTSSIVTSSITAAGPIIDNLSTGNAAYQFSVGVDGPNNAFMLISAPSTNTAYADVRVSDSTNAPIEFLREQISLGSAQLGYVTNPAAPATTGIRFISSLNGGPDTTALVGSGEIFPLGCQLIPVAGVNLGDAEQKALTPSFSTIANHTYSVDIQIGQESVTGTVGAGDHISYYVAAAGGANTALATTSLVELSTIGGSVPNGRSLHGVITASGTSAQLIVQTSATTASTIVVPFTTGYNGMLLRDLGPANLVIAP